MYSGKTALIETQIFLRTRWHISAQVKRQACGRLRLELSFSHLLAPPFVLHLSYYICLPVRRLPRCIFFISFLLSLSRFHVPELKLQSRILFSFAAYFACALLCRRVYCVSFLQKMRHASESSPVVRSFTVLHIFVLTYCAVSLFCVPLITVQLANKLQSRTLIFFAAYLLVPYCLIVLFTFTLLQNMWHAAASSYVLLLCCIFLF